MELFEDGVGFARNGKASCHVSMHVLCVYTDGFVQYRLVSARKHYTGVWIRDVSL